MSNVWTFICFAAFCCPCFCRASGRGTCVVSGHVIRLYFLSAAFFFFARYNENRDGRETLNSVPDILRSLREPRVIEGPAAAAAVAWLPPGPAPAHQPAAAGLPRGPAPAQQAQGVVYNARQDGSHFIDGGAQDGGGRMKRRRAPQHCFDCGHVKQKGPFSRYHVPSLPRARQSPSNIADGADGAKCSCPKELRRKALKSHSKVKDKFGGQCNCEGDERHPGGCKGVRIGS